MYPTEQVREVSLIVLIVMHISYLSTLQDVTEDGFGNKNRLWNKSEFLETLKVENQRIIEGMGLEIDSLTNSVDRDIEKEISMRKNN